MDTIPKVLAYITRQRAGETQVLVFEQRDPPEDGLQVPGGTVQPGETIVTGLWREIAEESGLTDLTLCRCVASALHKGDWGCERRHVFHLEAPPGLPDRWSHTVTAGEEDQGMLFVYGWLSLAEASTRLVHGQGDWLQLLMADRSYPSRT
jgi:8-oxo-dGTP pyrophosphatase MutT (NUDIX family)